MEGDEATRRRADYESSDDEDCMFNPDMFVNRNYTKQAFTFGTEPDSRFTVELTVLPSASTDFDLTGQVVWPCATWFSEYLVDHPELVQGKNVLELGAGVGLCGLVAHKLGAKVCILTEGNDEVTTILKQNVEELLLKQVSTNEEGRGVLDAAKHLWGQDLDAFEQRFPYKYDVIMGSDIIFFDDGLEGMMLTLDRLLHRTKEAVVFLAYSSRSRVGERKLMRLIEASNFVATTIAQQGENETYILALHRKL